MICEPSSPAPVGRPKRHHASSHKSSQDWLHTRFANVSPEDFCNGGVLFYTAQVLEAPVGFENVWGGAIGTRFRNGGGEAGPEEHEAISVAVVVVLFADLQDKEQMKSVIDMRDFLEANLGDAAPLLIYVPHSICPEMRKPMDLDDSLARLMHVLDDGIDEAITGEPEGMMLALEIQNRVLAQNSLLQKLNDELYTLEEHETNAQHALFLQDVIHDTVWDYLRVRLRTDIPAIDWSIAPDIPQQIENYKLGVLLGEGSFGKVYKLECADGDQEPTGSVVKAVPKKSMCDVVSLYNVKKQIDVMQILSVDWPHPNVTKLYNVYHSETHLFFELEDCGPVNLYKFYRESERRQCPLSPAKTQAIIHQMIAAICHMHMRPKVVHCDLKPENIIITETPNNVLIKISDFDTAQVDPKLPQYGVVGTFPFSAPEIILEGEFDPYAADIWSMGLVLLELLCFSQVLERALQLDSGSKAKTRRENSELRRQMMAKIRGFFAQEEALGCLLQENARHDLHDVLSHSFLLLLQDMLNVSCATRIPADRLIQVMESRAHSSRQIGPSDAITRPSPTPTKPYTRLSHKLQISARILT